jgi:hypothetical protein
MKGWGWTSDDTGGGSGTGKELVDNKEWGVCVWGREGVMAPRRGQQALGHTVDDGEEDNDDQQHSD